MANKTKYGDKLITYAQNAEDIKLYGYFWNLDKPGFYVDVGANDAVHDSVTKFFYLRGWRGINIEPQKHLIDVLNRDRPKDININTGISDKPGKLKFRQYDSDGLSTFSTNLHKSYEKGHESAAIKFNETELNLVTLESIFAKHWPKSGAKFLKVDVEGFEYNVLKGNNWKKYRPWVICIESTGEDKRWQKILEKEGYIKHLFDGLNDYYVAKEHYELIPKYHATVSSAIIRYDIAFLPNMKYAQKLRDVKNKVVKGKLE